MSQFSQVKRYIDALDAYGLLAAHAPADEYDAESKTISAHIAYSDAPETIAAVIAKVMQTAFAEPETPERFLETAVSIRRALGYEHYGHLSDIFEYGSEDDADCIRPARQIIAEIPGETDSVMLETMLDALHKLVTHRNAADQLDLTPLAENWQKLDAAAPDCLPEILEAAKDTRYDALIRRIREIHAEA